MLLSEFSSCQCATFGLLTYNRSVGEQIFVVSILGTLVNDQAEYLSIRIKGVQAWCIQSMTMRKSSEDWVTSFLKFYTMDRNLAKTKSKVAALRKAANETQVQFADVLKTKVVWCEDASSGRGQKAFLFMVWRQTFGMQSGCFGGREQNAQFLGIAQYTNALLKQTIQVLEPARVVSYRIRCERGRRNNLVAIVAGQGSRTPQVFHRGQGGHQKGLCNATPNSIGSNCLNGLYHCRVCLVTDHYMDHCPYSVRSSELAQLRETIYQTSLATVATPVYALKHLEDPEPRTEFSSQEAQLKHWF